MAASDVEADVEDVSVLDDVGLALEPLLARARRIGVRAGRDEVVPADHLAADEPARDVGMDRRGRVQRRAAATERPRPRFLLAGREEDDEVEGLEQPPRNLRECGLALAERGRLL